MRKPAVTAADLASELDRRIREQARGPYARFFNTAVPRPIPLSARDAQGCNWTVVSPTPTSADAASFMDLVVTRLRLEYDLLT